jgi:hypothetical protein
VPPYKHRNTEWSSSPSKPGALGENATHRKLEKPHFLFLEGSGGAPTVPVAVAAALADAPAALASASAVRAASFTDRSAAGASAPAAGACFSATSMALGDGGGGFHLSGGARPTSLFSSSSSSDAEFSGVTGGESPFCSLAPGAPAARSSSPSSARPAPAPVAARRGRPLGLGAWAGHTAWCSSSPSAKKMTIKTAVGAEYGPDTNQ